MGKFLELFFGFLFLLVIVAMISMSIAFILAFLIDGKHWLCLAALVFVGIPVAFAACALISDHLTGD